MSWLGAATRHVEINRRLSSCKNFQELQQVIDSADGSLSLVNMVTAMHRLAKVATGHKRESRALSQQLQKKLSQALALEGSRKQVAIRTWSNTAWAMAKLRLHDVELFQMAGEALTSKVHQVQPQELANILWSFGANALSSTALDLEKCIGHLLQRSQEFEVQHLSNVAWSLAKLSSDPKLLQQLAAVAIPARLGEFSSQHVGNVAWACAKLSSEFCWSSVARTSVGRCFKPQEACNLLWAFATVSVDVGDDHMSKSVAALGNSLHSQLDRCNPQDHANFLWSMVVLTAAERQMCGAIAQSACDKLDEFSSTQLSAVLWAVSKASFDEPGLFQASAGRLRDETMTKSLGTQHVANLLWSFAVAQHRPEMVHGLTSRAMEMANEFRSQELTGLLWAFAGAGWSESALIGPLARSSTLKVLDFRADELATVAAALARLNQDSSGLYRSCLQRLGADPARWIALSADEVVATLWALAHAKKHLTVEMSSIETNIIEAAAAACVATADCFTAGQISSVLAALTRLVPVPRDHLVLQLLQKLHQGQRLPLPLWWRLSLPWQQSTPGRGWFPFWTWCVRPLCQEEIVELLLQPRLQGWLLPRAIWLFDHWQWLL